MEKAASIYNQDTTPGSCLLEVIFRMLRPYMPIVKVLTNSSVVKRILGLMESLNEGDVQS